MSSTLLQYIFSGLTTGSTYALAALGFTLIYNASGVINFAQGEFLMLGGVFSFALVNLGLPLWAAVLLAIALTGGVGLAMYRLAIAPARNADVVSLIIVTIGASLVIRGLVQLTLGKGTHPLPSFSGDRPIAVFGASLLPQSVWVFAATAVAVLLLALFFGATRSGKAMLATAHNRLAAQLVGIDVDRTLQLSFLLSALLGALGGALLAPITFVSFDAGALLGLKGFVAAVLGGLGGAGAAIVGGLLVGLFESLTAGYLSSAYKDAVAFVLVLFILFVRPSGLFGARSWERV